MTERWERVARLLKTERVSNREVATRLRVAPRFVAEVRADLGLPPYRFQGEWSQEAFDRMTIRIKGGHRLWRGRFSPGGMPMASRMETAYRVGFRLHHGREAVGRVVASCSKKFCVEGAHRMDNVLREQAVAQVPTELPVGATYDGMDLVAIRRALRGPEPYPELEPGERKFAAPFAAPEMTDEDLARRLGSCARSVKKWREKGGPS